MKFIRGLKLNMCRMYLIELRHDSRHFQDLLQVLDGQNGETYALGQALLASFFVDLPKGLNIVFRGNEP